MAAAGGDHHLRSPRFVFSRGGHTMKRLVLISVAAIATSVFAADPSKHYQAAPDINSTGYSSAPTDEGRITVVFTGAKGMSKKKVAEFALLRAAELTAESGKEWFAVIDTKAQRVQLQAKKDDLDARAGGGFVTGESADTGNSTSRGDGATRGGPSTGGFGGGDVPYQVLERWQPPSVHQTVITIQMGTGDNAEFKGVTKTPEIFDARSTAEEIRAKMKK
jgi:hypothetical protein